MEKPKPESMTDWDGVRREDDSNAPIPYDPEDGPYDPNDPVATEDYLSRCDVIYQGKVIRKGRGPLKENPA